MNYFTSITQSDSPEFISQFTQTLRASKVVHFTGVPEGAAYKEYYRQLATAAGKFVKRDEDFRNGNQAEAQDDWMDIRFVDEFKRDSFRHSDTRQPIHTDGAYVSYRFDISFFFCTVQAEVGGATTFIDGVEVVRLLERYQPELLKALTAHEVIFDKGDQQRKVQRVIRFDAQGPLLNWNHFRISKDNAPEVIAMCDQFFEFTEKKIFEGGLLKPLILKPGEAVFFHDERVLHGRNAFLGDRCLIKGGIDL